MRAASSSPYSILPFMNWKIDTFRPCPAARIAKPRAAVVFPFPSPVYTWIYPLPSLQGRIGPHLRREDAITSLWISEVPS